MTLKTSWRRAAVLAVFAAMAFGAAAEPRLPAAAKPSNTEQAAFSRQLLEFHPGSPKLIEPETIFASTRAESGRMRVIVNLIDPPQRSRAQVDWSSDADLSVWRSQVTSHSKDVLAQLDKNAHEVMAVYENFAAFAVDVDATGLAALLEDPRVQSVEPERFAERFDAEGIPLLNATTVRTTHRGAGMTIAILDDGVDYTHPDLGGGGFPNSKVVSGIDTAGTAAGGAGDSDPRNATGAHGTACAGISGGGVPSGAGSPGSYIGGVAPDARIAAVKVFPDGADQFASSIDIVQGMDWCVTNRTVVPSAPIRVMSMSLGGGGFTSASSCDASNPSYLNAANSAIAAGIIVVAATGNNGFCNQIAAPACVSPIIRVGAAYDANIGTIGFCLDNSTCYAGATADAQCGGLDLAFEATSAKKVTMYSNVASFMDVFAPSNNAAATDLVGTAGYSTGNYTQSFGGTSAATPYVAGVIAILQSASFTKRGSYYTASEMRTLLVNNGDNITDTKNGGLNPGITKPFVNVQRAFDAIPGAATPVIALNKTTLAPVGTESSGPGNDTFTVRNSGAGTLSYTVSDNQTWLSVSPTSGTSTGEEDTVTVTYSTSGLTPGSYNATITVTASGASNSPQTIAVSLEIIQDCNGNGVPDFYDVVNLAAAVGSASCGAGPDIGPGFTYTGNTSALATDLVAASCADVGKSVFYTYWPAQSGQATISACDSSFDTVIVVTDGCGGAEVACNDDSSCATSTRSIATFNAVAGTVYSIRLGGFNGAGGAYSFTLTGPASIAGTSQDTNSNGIPDECDAPPCTVSASPTSLSFGASSGSQNLTVTASAPSCAWDSSESLDWVTLSPTSGTGGGTVQVTVTQNSGLSQRQGTITVAGTSVTVTQSGSAPPSDDSFESNNNLTEARSRPSLPVGTTSGLVSLNEDWYRLPNASCGTLRVTVNFTHANGNLNAELYDGRCTDSGGFPLRLAESYSTTNQETFTYVDRSGVGTELFLRIYGEGGATNPSYSVTIAELGADDALEPNNSPCQFTSINLGQTYNDLILKDDDFYLVNTTGLSSINVRMEANKLSGQLYFMVMAVDPGCGYDILFGNFTPNLDVNESLNIPTGGRSQLLVRVYGATRGTNTYNLRVSTGARSADAEDESIPAATPTPLPSPTPTPAPAR
ncbi:MAG: S8 family serine peptidase [Candidatus Sumerlaeia bacterium]|nr:S8 family serine peptidase [Candidatus Sumerlaeia bacterium]